MPRTINTWLDSLFSFFLKKKEKKEREKERKREREREKKKEKKAKKKKEKKRDYDKESTQRTCDVLRVVHGRGMLCIYDPHTARDQHGEEREQHHERQNQRKRADDFDTKNVQDACVVRMHIVSSSSSINMWRSVQTREIKRERAHKRARGIWAGRHGDTDTQRRGDRERERDRERGRERERAEGTLPSHYTYMQRQLILKRW